MVNLSIEDIIKKSKEFFNSLSPFFKVSITIICFSIVFLVGYNIGEPIGKNIYYLFH